MEINFEAANNTISSTNEEVKKTKEEELLNVKGIKDCRTVKDYINFLLQQGEWEMYTYEWLLNRRSFLYYNTLHGSYFFYQENNELVLFNEESFYLYICTFEKTEFIRHLFFQPTEKKKLKIKCYIKTMQGRRMKQEDRYITISDLTKYIDPTDYKTLYFYKRNPICFYAICDGHRGIKACEYCQNNLIKNIIFFFYGKKETETSSYTSENELEKKNEEKKWEENEGDFGNTKKRKINECKMEGEGTQEMGKESVKNVKEEKKGKEKESKIIKELGSMSDEEIAELIKMAFKKTDADFLKTSKFALHGCTVISLIIFKNKMFVANLGDCRAIGVIKKNNLLIHEVLSYDHKPNLPKEKERIKLNGGDVLCFQNVYRVVANANKGNKKKSVANGLTMNEEVYLSVSRAIGDKDFKYREVLSTIPDVTCREVCQNDTNIDDIYEKEQEKVTNENEGEKKKKSENQEKNKEKPKGEKEEVGQMKKEEEKKENQEHNGVEKKEEDIKTDQDKKRKNKEKETHEINEEEANDEEIDEDETTEEEINEEETKEEETNDELCYTSDELQYHFVFMACDGVWDILSNQNVVQIIQNYENDPDKACSEIIKTAYRKGSQDNLTAMLFKFF